MPASLKWLVSLPDDQFSVQFLQHVKEVAKKHNRTERPDLLIWSRISTERYYDWKEGVKLALEADSWARCQEILAHTGRPKGGASKYHLPLDAIRAYIMRKEGQAWQDIIKTLPPQSRSLRIPERRFRKLVEHELHLDLWS